MYCVVVSQCRSFNNDYHRFVHYCDFGIPFIYYPYVYGIYTYYTCVETFSLQSVYAPYRYISGNWYNIYQYLFIFVLNKYKNIKHVLHYFS